MQAIAIDWLQFTSPFTPARYLNEARAEDHVSHMRFYKRMLKYPCGAQAHIGNPNSTKYLIVMPGKTCEKLDVSHTLVKQIISDGGNVTRLDIALTTDTPIVEKFFDSQDKFVSELYVEIKGIVDSKRNIQTAYVGDHKKRGKNGIVRCYDKGAELGIDGILHRIEIETRRKHALISAKRIANGESLESVMNSKFRIDADWYRQLLGSNISTSRFPTTTANDDTDDIAKKMNWLESQVVPTLRKIWRNDLEAGTQNMSRLLEQVFRDTL